MNDDDCSSRICDRCCPYGPFLPVASVLAVVATLLTWIASFACHFYEANGLGIGLWTVEDPFSKAFNDFVGKSSDQKCYGWNMSTGMRELLDPPMNFARALSIIACLSSAVVSVMILLPSCTSLPRIFFKSLAISMFFLSFIVMLCLVALASDFCTDVDDCNIGFAGILCIVASVLWAGAGCATLASHKKPEPVLNSSARVKAGEATAILVPRTAGEVASTTLSPDGTLTTTHTTTIANLDGSMTVSSEFTAVTPRTTTSDPVESESTEVTPGIIITNHDGSEIGS